MILIHHLVEEIVDVQFRTTIDNGLHLVQQFIEIDTLCRGNIVEGHLTVDTLDNLHLQHRFLCHRTNTHICLTFDTILFAVFLDEIHEFLGIGLFHLTLSDALDVLQLFQCHRIISSHLFQRHILEDDIRRTLHSLRHLLAQIPKHATQRGIKGTNAALGFHRLIILRELSILHNHKRRGTFQEFLTRRGHFQQTIVLHLLLQIACN